MTMTEIYIQTTLEKSNGQYWSGNVRDYFNSSYEMSNAATSCSQGPDSFRTRVSYVIQAPPGVNPRYTANTIYSPWIGVACGVTLAANPPSETIERVQIPVK